MGKKGARRPFKNSALTTETKGNAASLFAAAQQNRETACGQLYGQFPLLEEDLTVHQVNSRALRVAAENRSYDALKAMIKLAIDETNQGYSSPYQIQGGDDWATVITLSTEDDGIKAILNSHAEALDHVVLPTTEDRDLEVDKKTGLRYPKRSPLSS